MKFIFLFFLLSLTAWHLHAHEGHDTPGALPTALFGGRLGAAEELGGHQEGEEHEHDDESEIFIELKLDGSTIKIFAHALDPKDPSTFTRLSPGPELTLTTLRIEQPRTKVTGDFRCVQTGDHWETSIAQVTAKRMIAYVTLRAGAESKQAKIQLERY